MLGVRCVLTLVSGAWVMRWTVQPGHGWMVGACAGVGDALGSCGGQMACGSLVGRWHAGHRWMGGACAWIGQGIHAMRWTVHLGHAVDGASGSCGGQGSRGAWAGQSCHAVDGVLGHAVDEALMRLRQTALGSGRY